MTSRLDVEGSLLVLDELSCCVCRELLQEPKLLNCGHTVCVTCLGQMREYVFEEGDIFALHRPAMREVIRCPFCRQCSNLPYNGIEAFPTNFLVKRLVELQPGIIDIREIKTKIAESKELLTQVQNTVKNIEETMKLVEDKKQTTVSDISQVFDLLVEKLRERQEELLECCSYKAATRIKDLRHRKHRTKQVECIMKGTIERAEQSLGSAADVAQSKEAILHELNELELFLVFNEPTTFSNFHFVAEGEEEVLNRISELGFIQSAFDMPEHTRPVAVPCHTRGVDVIRVIESWSGGDEQSGLTLPWGVTIATSDVVMVADHHNNRILLFDQEWNFLMCYGEEHNICLPTSVAVSDEGNILVLDSGNHCIKELNSSGELLRCVGKIGSGTGEVGERAEGLTVDYEGRLILADTGNNRVQVFHRNGTMAMKFGDTGEHSLSRPSCAVYHNGKFIVSDTHNHCLKFYNRTGNLIRHVGLPGRESGQFRHPRGLTVDGHNNILVCDSGNCRIQVLDFNGNFITSFGTMGSEEGQFFSPYAIAINSQGAVVVTDCNNNRIQILRFKTDAQ